MLFPSVGGTPDQGFPDGSGYIPPRFARRLVKWFYVFTVFGAICNTYYENEIRQMGDEVIIPQLPTPIVRPYVQGGGLVYDRPVATAIRMPIDQGIYWAYEVNDVLRAQAQPGLIDKWAEHHAMYAAIEVDRDILEAVYADAHVDNQGSTAGAITSSYNMGVAGTPLGFNKSNAVGTLLDCHAVLQENNIPKEGRWAVMPAWMVRELLESDIKTVMVTGDDTSPLRNGEVGMVAGFRIYESNNILPVTDGSHTAYHCIFGTKEGISFASQLVKNETLRDKDDFGDFARALQVYGRKVTNSKALGHLYTERT